MNEPQKKQSPDFEHLEKDAYHDTWNDGHAAGYDEGFDAGKLEKIDLTIAGAILVGLIAGAIGFALGVTVWAAWL